MTSNTGTAKKTVAARKKPVATDTPKTRISTARHRKSAGSPEVELAEVSSAPVSEIAEDRHTAISRIAYGFWEMRGFQGGDPASDWFLAEEEYARRQMTMAAQA